MLDELTRLKTALADRYTIERELGAGGMAAVYLAEDLKHHRKVAVKVLRPELAAGLGPDRFLREITTTAQLTHPHILPLYDSGNADGFLFYVMPFVEGESLRDRLNREKQLPVQDAVRITREVADALSHAHSLGIVHRDIKPENILFEARHAVVSDFGIARAVSHAGGQVLTETGIAVGTPAYMSPEQGAGDRNLDGRSDLYSLGCVLYEMLGGEPPHTGPTPQAILARQLAGEVRSLQPLRAGVSSELEAVIRRALAKTPADRYATCHDFVAALERRRSKSGVQRIVARPRSLVWWVVPAFLIAAAVFAVQWMFAPNVVATDRLGVAVFPFRPTGGGAAEWSEALADLLATALDGTPGIRIADPWSLWSPLRPERSARAESPDPVEATRLALRAGVSRYVLGSTLRAGDQLTVTLRVYDVNADQPTHTITESGALDSIQSIVDRLAVGLIGQTWARGDSATPPIKRYATQSPTALKAYLHAREAMRRGQVAEAESAIDSALALDSTFALALVEAIGIKSWARYMRGEFFDLMDLATRAENYADSLAERERLRVAGTLASVRTDGVTAADAAGRILEIDSTDFIAWNNLAYYHLVYGWQYGKSELDALLAAERVVALDSTYVPGLILRTRLALVTGNRADAERQARRLHQTDSANALVRGMLVATRSVLASDSTFRFLIDTLAVSSPSEWIAAYRELRILRPDRADSLLERIRSTTGPGFSASAAERAQARLWIAQGRLGHVDSLIRYGRYQRNDFYRTLQHFLVAATLAGVGNDSVASRAVAALADNLPVDSAVVYAEERDVWWTGWLVGAYHAQFGDTTITRRWHEALGRLPAGGTSKDYRAALQRDLEGRLAARRGDVQHALALEHEAYDLWTIHTENDHEAHPAPAIRFQMAMLLRETAQPDSAQALFRSLLPPGTWMGFLTARASFELGKLAEERGDLESVAKYYGAALRLWDLGDDDILDWREDARARVERVVRRRG